jgi:hypothetical protein
MNRRRFSGKTILIAGLLIIVVAAVLGWSLRPKSNSSTTQLPLASVNPSVQPSPLKTTDSPSPAFTPATPAPTSQTPTPTIPVITASAPQTTSSATGSVPSISAPVPSPTTGAPVPATPGSSPKPTPTPTPSPSLAAAAVDLSKWTDEAYPAMSDEYYGPAWWSISADAKSVTETRNSQPAFFLSDFPAMNISLHVKIKAQTMAEPDDDYVGFALGIQPKDTNNHQANFLLIDWKNSIPGEDLYKDFNSPGPGGQAKVGLAVSRVQGVPTPDQYWQHTLGSTGEGLTELARGTKYGSVGWSFDRDYDFSFIFDATSLMVYLDGALEISIAGNFKDGRVALYEFSQEGVSFMPY